ncbi:MAG TPA: SGNH/GDSL hydrolase family protein, partial [Verrucomicrobiae bacterium]|nr:SGNH/GDSL hydrolase family protein [Verrucomicrobiae bacterium]
QHHNAFINSLQCRSDKEVSLPKPPGTFRIFIIGGSTAYGSGASSQDKTIGGYLTSILQKELAPETKYNYEVFTLATPSWASTQERIIIENKLLDWQPDLVISFSGNNDVHWGMLGRNVLWFRTYQEEFNWHILEWASKEFQKKPLTDVVPVESHPIAPSLVADRLERNVRLSALALGMTNIPYIFCLQPTLAMTKKPLDDAERNNLANLSTIDHTLSGSNYFSQCYTLIDSELSTLKMDNFIYVNLTGVFDTMKTPDRLFLDCYHFGDKGNAIIARGLFDSLKKLLAASQFSSAGSR